MEKTNGGLGCLHEYKYNKCAAVTLTGCVTNRVYFNNSNGINGTETNYRIGDDPTNDMRIEFEAKKPNDTDYVG